MARDKLLAATTATGGPAARRRGRCYTAAASSAHPMGLGPRSRWPTAVPQRPPHRPARCAVHGGEPFGQRYRPLASFLPTFPLWTSVLASCGSTRPVPSRSSLSPGGTPRRRRFPPWRRWPRPRAAGHTSAALSSCRPCGGGAWWWHAPVASSLTSHPSGAAVPVRDQRAPPCRVAGDHGRRPAPRGGGGWVIHRAASHRHGPPPPRKRSASARPGSGRAAATPARGAPLRSSRPRRA